MAPLILHSCVNKSSKILLIAFHNLGIAARVVGGGGGGEAICMRSPKNLVVK